MSSNADSLISSALSQVNYRHPDKTKRDVVNLLHHYKGLAPVKSKFTFNDGQEMELIQLKGTVPVPYKGQTYNIPVSVWLLDTHPVHAPICYVVPTQDMQVKVSKHVDAAGKIYLPYLHEWNQANSDLLGLIQVCIVTFSEKPPVFSRPRQPQYPPYPPQNNMGYPPQPNPGYPNSVYPPQTTPGYPPQTTPGYPPQPTPGYPPANGGYPPYMNSNSGPGYPPGPSPAYPPYPPSTTSPSPSISSQSSLSQEQIKASILSAVEDKVRRKLRDEWSQTQAEVVSLRRTQEELNQGQTKLKGMKDRLEMETSALENDLRVLDEKKTELEKISDELETVDDIPVDEAVDASTPLYRQLMESVAEEAATEDVIYCLGEAIRRGSLDTETFLRKARDVSRKQFLARATIMKARQKAGLGA